MKNSWKFGDMLLIKMTGDLLSRFFLQSALCILIFIFISCNNKEQHKHISDKNAVELDGLIKPVNQIVFADVKTISPSSQVINPIVNANGVIAYNPKLINNISARYGGRIEKLYVRYNFQPVYKGQRILDIYSPEILTEQQDLIFMLKNSGSDSSLISASKQRLLLLGLTGEQINQIIIRKIPINPLPIYSQYTGHIHDIGISNGISSTSSESGMSSGMNATSASQPQIENIPSSQTSAMSIKEGMYLQIGQPLFAVYDISNVWAVINIFQRDASFIKTGNKVVINSETETTDIIIAKISYIEPVIGQNGSSIKARVYLNNTESTHFKIGTILSAKVFTDGIKGIWLPRNALINIGKSQVVFLKEKNYFSAQKVTTGFINDTLVQITGGLTGAEEVALNAHYLVDSESFIKTPGNEN